MDLKLTKILNFDQFCEIIKKNIVQLNYLYNTDICPWLNHRDMVNIKF